MNLADEIHRLMNKPQITEVEHKRALEIMSVLIRNALARKSVSDEHAHYLQGALMFYLRDLGFIH